MTGLANRRILLGVTGSIAAVKVPEIVRRCRAEGAEVRVVMTRNARAFVTPLALQGLSGHAVASDHLEAESEAAMPHIDLARWAELVCIAPATANTLARLAHGLADDLLTDLCLVTEAPLLVAPAMNRRMWSHPATVANVALLASRGVGFVGPEDGEQACGETGVGRMSEPGAVVEAIRDRLSDDGPLSGLRVVVTAGPTREPVDPVRYLTNRSSGRMGYAIARAAREAGADVVLVSGPVALEPPPGVACRRVETAAEMAAAVEAEIADCAIFIATAAVADYRPASVAGGKIKKRAGSWSLPLVRNPDILATVAAASPRPFCVGFAAETEDVEAHARAKLEAKRIDLIAANDVGRPGQGFDSEFNALDVFWNGGERRFGRCDKTTLARRLIELIAERFHARD